MLTVVDDMGRIKDEVKCILDQIAQADAVLSAGHLHISEIWPLFEEAKARGVNRRLVQHPTFVIDANLRDIGELVADGTFIEHSICTVSYTHLDVYKRQAYRWIQPFGAGSYSYTFSINVGCRAGPNPDHAGR